MVNLGLMLLVAVVAKTSAFRIDTQALPSSRSCLHVGKNFDFSSTVGWEEFYQEDDTVVEWHSSVSLEMIADLVPIRSNCLVVGCGNSNLPRFIHDQTPNISITCLDSSQTCLDQLKTLHASDCPRMSFLCGDAVNLSYTLDNGSCGSYDSIVDKGLVDALMCGEGWNGPVAQLFADVGKVLMPGGSYILVCYKLSASTREFLQQVGNEASLSWTFDLQGSNDRVSISIASKVQ
jgi:EEF1A lysine methyltransferase 4